MAILQHTSPASLRFGLQPAQENRGASQGDRRPYLVTIPTRRSTTTARQSVVSTRQFFALFPHESEDARITGTTRSLYRRLLALNLPKATIRTENLEVLETTEGRFTLSSTRIA
jgi:hypothetical protein